MRVEQEPETRFSRSAILNRLKSLTQDAVTVDDFENKWRRFITAFQNWEDTPTAKQTSGLNVRLEFIRCLCAAFPSARLNKNDLIVELVLTDSGAKKVGDTLTGKLPNGDAKSLKVAGREISDAFGILYTLETEGGFRFTREFFD